MNSRRRLLQFLGLGSLFATTAAVTASQANGRDTHLRTTWQYRVVWVDLNIKQKYHRDLLERILNRETQDGWEFLSMGEGLLRSIVFRKRVLWTA